MMDGLTLREIIVSLATGAGIGILTLALLVALAAFGTPTVFPRVRK